MRLLWNYVKRYQKLLLAALVLAAINQFFSLLDPQIVRLIIDRYATHPEVYSAAEFFRSVVLLLAAFVGVAFISRVAKSFQDYCVQVVTQRVGATLYADSVAHSFSLPFQIFEDQRSGELLQKLEKARLDSQQLIASSVNVVFLALIGMSVVIGYAFFVHWLVGVGYALIIPTLGSAIFLLSRAIRTTQTRIVAEQAAMAGATTETLRNVELVKSLGLERQEIDRLNAVNERILQLELTKVRLIRMFSFTQGTLMNGMRAALMLLMLWLIFNSQMTIGEFFTLFVYSFFIFSPLAEFGVVATQYQETSSSLAQLQQILSQPVEHEPSAPKAIERFTDIRFDRVGFRYPSGILPAVHDIQLRVRAGETVAFVGPSGSGKTTVIKLLVGLYRATSGQMFLGDQPADQLNRKALRARIGLVAQETQLFAGTIRENLLFVRPHATDVECVAALRQAAAESILSRGGRGLDTRIGEGGLKLSGGERQRLAIARALLRKPDLLIFDEATSSLDSITEKEITSTIQAIEKQHPELMTVLVAHRLSTVAHADRIYVFEQGRIIEQGTHAQLLKTGGLYAALWRQQVAVDQPNR